MERHLRRHGNLLLSEGLEKELESERAGERWRERERESERGRERVRERDSERERPRESIACAARGRVCSRVSLARGSLRPQPSAHTSPHACRWMLPASESRTLSRCRPAEASQTCRTGTTSLFAVVFRAPLSQQVEQCVTCTASAGTRPSSRMRFRRVHRDVTSDCGGVPIGPGVGTHCTVGSVNEEGGC